MELPQVKYLEMKIANLHLGYITLVLIHYGFKEEQIQM